MSARVLHHPNFPRGLDITPLVSEKDEKGSFDAEAQKSAIQRFGIAGRIWEAAQLMTRYFELSESTEWQFDPPCSMIRREDESDLTIVELGSGTGYVGLKLAEQLLRLERINGLLVLTDLSDVCPLLEETLGDERQRWRTSHLTHMDTIPVKILPLSWGDTAGTTQLSGILTDEKNAMGEPRYLTHLVCSDLVYFPHLLAPLLRSLLQLTLPPFSRPGQSPEVIISYKIRSLTKEMAFWSAFGLWFTFFPVLARHGTNRTLQELSIGTEQEAREEQDWHIFGPEGFIFAGHRRPESNGWVVPDSDSDLLAGVGAQGSEIPKSDDAFETLLMMQMSTREDAD